MKGRKTAEGKGNKEKEEKREIKKRKERKKWKRREIKEVKKRRRERERRGQLPMKSVRQLYHHLATMMNILFLCVWRTIVGQA